MDCLGEGSGKPFDAAGPDQRGADFLGSREHDFDSSGTGSAGMDRNRVPKSDLSQ